MNITVLGGGLVGSAIVKDLAANPDFAVTVVDLSAVRAQQLAEQSGARGVVANLGALERFDDLLADADLVVCAVPGFMGFATLKKIIEAGKNVVDISFFGEDPFLLDDLAKERGVTAVVDCGVAPGLSNIVLGALSLHLDRIERYDCYVGGLPQERRWPYEYKAVFSPIDVLEEYTRPARYVEYGREVVRPALSDIELLDFPHVGTLEAFNTDGLRSLARTMDIPFMKEKTLRYPGHANLMRVFRDSGFLDTEPVEIDGTAIAPIKLTSRLLFDQWKLKEGEYDMTVMQVVVDGSEDGRPVRYIYDMTDTFDRATGTHSMARTTGYTCTAVARLVARGDFRQPGICPPEYVGRTPGCADDVQAYLAARGVNFDITVVDLA